MSRQAFLECLEHCCLVHPVQLHHPGDRDHLRHLHRTQLRLGVGQDVEGLSDSDGKGGGHAPIIIDERFENKGYSRTILKKFRAP